MILPPDYEARVIDTARRCTDDIVECAAADITFQWLLTNPAIRFSFGDARLFGRPTLTVGLLAESRVHPLEKGRLLTIAQIERHVRTWVEDYLKLNGLEMTRKVVTDACV